ncbi:MAG: ATP-dependent protease subunit HslV [Fimbriimonadales bacterium]|jgi:ATP-dependent HslUV protease subunit HslV|nr:ATP-dependent protease subunit HslV [Armatimonadota bacterium]MCX7688013.1 ATP-dependent protease subunit HslV [Fimbriimonadales bacterium]CUU02045.1 ATP-dependent HslUV protease, peptidase subunit HslV [Armatimonadetes bacterium GBS]CUU35667.1 ATP-dependent HslUV protease, peptidase subunit HslV [Armatimonadetes bacterium GXS]CUU38487.1 ATP-dependent HslUV protease, peptidase subunit HslV [Armatimonadetes bacterium DC]GBC89641.1 ATP-dependent protease subunit HslV [bacterium HR14]
MHGTTVLAVRRGNQIAFASDGQITMGEVVIKHTARKVRWLYHNRVLAGIAGAAADAQALLDRFEAKLEATGGNLRRAAVEFAKDWRTDRILRQLNALMVVADKETMLVVAGDGNVLEPDEDVIGIGSGGAYAQAAAQALLRHTALSAREIAEEALRIASQLCIYTNDHITLEVLETG